jgi:hypothetical protein
MTTDPNDGSGSFDAPDPHLPATDAGPRGSALARQPMEQIARAMQAQAELMKQMHERQRMLEDVVKDNRRHELVINSAQALNESFQGLQRVQERLADKLDESGGLSRGRSWIIGLALLALAGVGGVLTWKLTQSADAINSNLRTALDPRVRDQRQDQELQATLEKLERRVQGVEAADRAAFQDEIDRLRKSTHAIEAERDTLRRERDGAREELGVAKASLATKETEVADTKGKMQGLEKDNARLSAEALAQQKILVQLNDVIATMKTPGTAAPAKLPATEPEVAKKPPPPEPPPAAPPERVATPTPTPPPAAPAGDRVASAKPEAADAGSVPDSPVAFPPAQLENVNALLKAHSGSDVYELKRADKAGQGKLWNVAMEVRAPDGKVTKTIEAETLSFTAGEKLLEIVFEGGNVTFHQGPGKSVKSPFFNNRYLIVVLGINGKDWQAAGLPFVKGK